MPVFRAGNCVCEEKNGCNECLPFFSLNPLPSSSLFLSSAHAWHHYSHRCCWNGSTMEHLIVMAAGLIDATSLGKSAISTEPVQGKRCKESQYSEEVSKSATKPDSKACARLPLETQCLLPLVLLMWNRWNVDVYLVKWRGCKVLQSATPNHLAHLFRAWLFCRQ